MSAVTEKEASGVNELKELLENSFFGKSFKLYVNDMAEFLEVQQEAIETYLSDIKEIGEWKPIDVELLKRALTKKYIGQPLMQLQITTLFANVEDWLQDTWAIQENSQKKTGR